MIEKFNSYNNQFPLENPCMIDFETNAGLLTLMMDKDYPAYLFVSFNGELRKCVHLEDAPPELDDDDQVFDYLRELKTSPLVESLIKEEDKINQAWENL